LFLDEPAGQSKQELAPVLLPNLPSGQSTQLDAGSGELAVPGGTKGSSKFRYFPTAQGTQIARPVSELNKPSAQSWQLAAPELEEY